MMKKHNPNGEQLNVATVSDTALGSMHGVWSEIAISKLGTAQPGSSSKLGSGMLLGSLLGQLQHEQDGHGNVAGWLPGCWLDDSSRVVCRPMPCRWGAIAVYMNLTSVYSERFMGTGR